MFLRCVFIFSFLQLFSFAIVIGQVTKIHGLAVVVDFEDFTHAMPDVLIDSMLNQRTGYKLAGNAGSLYEYYKDQTNGKYEVTHTVVRIKFDKKRNYFRNSSKTNPDTGQPWDWGQAFADSVLKRVEKNYPNGFVGLTRYLDNPKNGIGSWLVLVPFGYSAFGVHSAMPLKSDNQLIPMNHVGLCDIGVGTIDNHMTRILAHESAHSIFRLPDVGHQKGNDLTVRGSAGSYCMMGWHAGGERTPIDFSAPLLLTFKVVNVVDITKRSKNKISIKSNARDTLYRFVNPNNPREYFIFQSLNYSKWYPNYNFVGNPMDIGLAVWHVIEDNKQSKNPWFRLVQSDGVDLMNDRSQKPPIATGNDNRVLFGKSIKHLSSKDNKMFRWLDGSFTGIEVRNISMPGERMSFTISFR